MLSGNAFRRTCALVGTTIVGLALTACVMTGEDDYARQQAQASSSAAESAGAQSESTPTGTDLSSGGACSDGEDAYINGEALEVTITGSCGAVRVEGTGITASVENATSVAIRGEGNTVSGTDWDSIQIQGIGLTASVENASDVQINGKNITVDVTTAQSVSLTGDGNKVTAGDVSSAALQGTGLTLTASSIAQTLTVEGTDNTVEWSDGIDKETSASGEGNTLTRK